MKLKLTTILLVAFLFYTCKTNAQTDVLHGKTFYIQASQPYKKGVNKGYWDVKGKNPGYKKGQNIMVWAKDNGADRKFKFLKDSKNSGYYVIIPLHGKKQNARLDVAGGGKTNGTNIHLWDMNGKDNQKFRVEFTSNGYARIFNKNGMVLCLKAKSYENGSNVHTWANHQGHQTEWALIDVNTSKRFIPQRANANIRNNGLNIYTLQNGEEFVYGKIGFKGTQRYTVAVVRKYNSNKEFYRFYGNYYADRPLGANLKKISNPDDYDKYDYYLIFNGKKFGSFDHIFVLGENGSSNIDKWVSDDGKHISFTGTVENKWYPIIYNNKASSFWSPSQAPQYAGNGNKWAYAMWWSKKDGYKLFEQGKPTYQYPKGIKLLSYSKSGKLLYVANSSDGNYVYVNHNKIDGPFKQFSDAGFLPNSEKIYYNTFSKVKIGNKEYTCKQDETVNGFEIFNNLISFIVLNRKTKQNTVYEYNIVEKEMYSHGTYSGNLRIRNYNGNLYYINHNIPANKYAVIGIGGKVLFNKQYLKGEGSPNCRMSPLGDLYVWYKSEDIWKIDKNGKSIAFNGKIAGIEPIIFNPHIGEPIIHSKIDKTVAGQKHHIYYGDMDFYVNGDLNAGKLYPTNDGKSVFYTIRTIQDNIWTYKLYKSGQIINNNAYAEIKTFVSTPSGNKYAMLVTNKQKGSYMILNKHMAANWKLVVNGKELSGKYGAPIWSKKYNAIIVMKQVGKNIVIEKLN